MATLCDRLVSAGGAPATFVVNPDISARALRLQTRFDLPNGQSVAGGSVLCAERTVVGLGATLVFGAAPVGGLTVSEGHLENSHLRIEFAEDGTLSRLFDKRVNREVLAGRGNQLWAYIDKPRNWDAWDIEEDYEANGAEIVELASRAVVERGPHRAALRLTRRFRDSTITQDIRLWANSPRVEFKTEIDWHDRRILLKARFPLLVRSDHATFECAFGIVRRPTHRNTAWEHARFEVAAHRFVDLAEPGYGVALLNDGKYGHHAVGNELAISLLRSPVYPDPYSDDGAHRFTYALYPHSGDWLSAGVLAEAEDLNRPLLCRSVTSRRESSWQAIAVEEMTLGLGGFKTAEDGDELLLRVYEPAGARGRVAARPAAGWRFTGELNVLEERTGDADMNFSPFQIHTWMLRRAR